MTGQELCALPGSLETLKNNSLFFTEYGPEVSLQEDMACGPTMHRQQDWRRLCGKMRQQGPCSGERTSPGRESRLMSGSYAEAKGLPRGAAQSK